MAQVAKLLLWPLRLFKPQLNSRLKACDCKAKGMDVVAAMTVVGVAAAPPPVPVEKNGAIRFSIIDLGLRGQLTPRGKEQRFFNLPRERAKGPLSLQERIVDRKEHQFLVQGDWKEPLMGHFKRNVKAFKGGTQLAYQPLQKDLEEAMSCFVGSEKMVTRLLAKKRLTWVVCCGIPLHAWSEEFLSKLLNLVGKYIALDVATSKRKRLDSARGLISTNSLTKIDSVVKVMIGDRVYEVSIMEDKTKGAPTSVEEMSHEVLAELKSDDEDRWSEDSDASCDPLVNGVVGGEDWQDDVIVGEEAVVLDNLLNSGSAGNIGDNKKDVIHWTNRFSILNELDSDGADRVIEEKVVYSSCVKGDVPQHDFSLLEAPVTKAQAFPANVDSDTIALTHLMPSPMNLGKDTSLGPHSNSSFVLESQLGPVLGPNESDANQNLKALKSSHIGTIDRCIEVGPVSLDDEMIQCIEEMETRDNVFLAEKEGMWLAGNMLCTVVNVYSSYGLVEKIHLWQEIRAVRQHLGNGLWIMLGDFNAVKSVFERRGIGFEAFVNDVWRGLEVQS
ncbi:hypothetical protein RIF29_38305 [Crotalaria pallida]|uniref:DUF4283 domain-containing protein n=1 Tax=Crotalaria pallida TaxID=3830 RepID=A0AAN9E0X3_CROPI